MISGTRPVEVSVRKSSPRGLDPRGQESDFENVDGSGKALPEKSSNFYNKESVAGMKGFVAWKRMMGLEIQAENQL